MPEAGYQGSRRFVQAHVALLVLAVAASALPFLNQPLHMDDNFYMDMARNALRSPLFPNDTPYNFAGAVLPDMGSHSHPPLQTYFLALLQRWFGEAAGREWLYHTAALVYPILAVVSFYFLAGKFVRRPLWPALLLAATPLFLVMQHSLMTDVPALAFWLCAVAAFVHAVDTRRRAPFALSALFQFAAMFTSYQSVALSPLLAFYAIRRRAPRAAAVSLVVPLVAMAAWFALNYAHYGRFILWDTAGYIQSRHSWSWGVLADKAAALIQYQGWLLIFPLFVLYLGAKYYRGRVAVLTVVTGIYAAQFLVPSYRMLDKGIFVIGFAAGSLTLGAMAIFSVRAFIRKECGCGFERSNAQFLALWYCGVAAYNLLLFTEGSARYLLPLAPPLIICFFRMLEHSETVEYRLPSRPLLSAAMVASGALVFTSVWGLALSRADMEFAGVYPRAAQEFSAVSGGMDAYYGGEWGFRYYFANAGVRQLPVDEAAVRGGSWIVRPKLALPYDMPAALQSMTAPVQTLSYEVSTPLRVLDWRTPAGFYSTGWGLIPFSLSGGSLEQVEIRQVNYFVERLPAAAAHTAAGPAPWTGFLDIQGKSPLAVLMRPGSRLSYPWDALVGLRLETDVGLSPDSYTDGKPRSFEFRMTQLGGDGRVVGLSRVVLEPGSIQEHRGWRAVRMLLEPAAGRGGSLVLELHSSDASAPATGAFAGALLRRQ